MSSLEALKHKWIANDSKNHKDFVLKDRKNVKSNLQNYKQTNKLNKAIKMFHVKINRNSKDVNRMRDLFLESDDNNNGTLEKHEFRNCMHKLYPNITDQDADEFFEMLDVNQDENIN